MAHFQGCTVVVRDAWPSVDDISALWVDGTNAAYIMVGDKIGYYNSLGERSFYAIEAPKELDPADAERKGAQVLHAKKQEAFEAKQAEIAAIKKLTNTEEALARIEALMHHQHVPIYSIPIADGQETLMVRLTPATEAVAKSHDQEAIEAQPQHLSYLIDAAQEQELYLHLTHKGVKRTTATAVSLLQKSVAAYQGDMAIKQESLTDYWQNTWGFQGSSEASLAKIANVSKFMQGLNGLTQPFTELESLINNAPKDQALAVLKAAIDTFKEDLKAKVKALKENLPLHSQDLLNQFLARAEAKIGAFEDRIAYLEAITPDATDIMRLFCAHNLDDPEALAEQSHLVQHVIPEPKKVFSLGKLENNLMHDLLDVGIDIVYDLTDDRLKQTLIKNPAVIHLAEAKESVRQQGGIYGARDVNTREVIPDSMLQRQRLCAMDPKDLASCKYLKVSDIPTVQTLAKIPGLQNAAYLVVGEDLYYVNKGRGQCQRIGQASAIDRLGLELGHDIPAAQLHQISKKTGHSTKQWVSSQSLIAFAGDLSEQDEGLCLLAKKKYHAKESYLSQHKNESKADAAWRVGHGIVTTAWWPVALSLEVAACGARVLLTGVSATVAIGSAKWADKIDRFGQQGHEWLTDTWGYAATQRAGNQYYRRKDITEGDDHQRVLTSVASSPDKLFSNIANHYLSGSSTVRIMGEQIRGLGRAIWNIPYEITGTFISAYERVKGQDWLEEKGLDDAVFEAPEWLPETRLAAVDTETPKRSRREIEKAEKAEKVELELLKKFEAMNAYFEELRLSEAAKREAEQAEDTLPVRYETAVTMELMRKADTDSILDFVDEVFVGGLCHTLINEMFNEAPLVSAVMFAVSLASFGIMTGLVAGPAALTYLPSIIGKSFTGQAANSGMVSASAANFLQFKLTSLACVGLSKIYEMDFKFLKSLGNHPEALLAFAALTAIGYGIGCLGHLPANIPVTVAGHSATIPMPLVIIPNSISPEAHEAIVGGVVPLISIELAFIGLKSLLFLDALASGRHHPDVCATRSSELLAGIVEVLLEKPEDRQQATLNLLEKMGVHLSPAMMNHAVVAQFFDNIQKFEVAHTAEARASNLNSGGLSSIDATLILEAQPQPRPEGDNHGEPVGPLVGTHVLKNDASTKSAHAGDKPKVTANHLFTPEQEGLRAAHAALSEELKRLQRYEALGIKVPKKDQERVFNHLDALYDRYNWRCRQQGRHDLQLDKSVVLRDFMLGHCYQGTSTGVRLVSSAVGILWRPFKAKVTNSAFVLEKARISDAKDALVQGHVMAMVGEMGRSFNLGVDGAARVMFSGFGVGALAFKSIDAMRNWYNGNTESKLYRAADAVVTHNIDLHNAKLPMYEQRQTAYANAGRGSDKISDLKTSLAADLTALADVARTGVKVYIANTRTEEKDEPNIDADTNRRYTRAALRQTALEAAPGEAVAERTLKPAKLHALSPLNPEEIRRGDDYHHNLALGHYERAKGPHEVRMPPVTASQDALPATNNGHHRDNAPHSGYERSLSSECEGHGKVINPLHNDD